ncbi:MAG: nuclear transport factor 2 family protein [Woeseiaceae bacterium]|nr:nuclear transport factor 2 family protein [Woeseiaceae bacterium]
MKSILTGLVTVLISVPAMAEDHDAVQAEARTAIKAFNEAYAGNDVDAYFDHYAADAMVYFYGARQDLSAYHEEWAEMVEAGGEVEKNELSDVQVQMMPSGDVAVASYFVDYRLRAPDGNVSVARAFESEVWQKIGDDWKVVNLHYSEIPDDQ